MRTRAFIMSRACKQPPLGGFTLFSRAASAPGTRLELVRIGRGLPRPYLIATLVFALLLTGCAANVTIDGATETPIIVTATPDIPPTAQIATSVLSTAAVIDLMPTQLAAASTSTPTPRATLEPTLTPSFTITPTDTITPTGGVPFNPGGAVNFGINNGFNSGFTGAATCTTPQGNFAVIYGADSALQTALGCALSGALPINSAQQDFENGRMIWASQLGDIPGEYIYTALNNGTYGRYPDTWIEGQDVAYDNVPPGKLGPTRGFGKVWRDNQAVRDGLGWALSPENGTGAQIQRFERGEMLYLSGSNQTFVFIANQSWRVF